VFVSADSAARPAEEIVRHCWALIARGYPFDALDHAERALRLYDPSPDSLLSGRLLLVVGVSLQALGRWEIARRYLADASWALERARASGELGPPPWRAARPSPAGPGDRSRPSKRPQRPHSEH
jgi:tetratricopeptide (TPR) repeat protein